jgi:hypothetical protein
MIPQLSLLWTARGVMYCQCSLSSRDLRPLATELYLAPLFFVVRLAISLSWRPKLIVPSALQSILKKASSFWGRPRSGQPPERSSRIYCKFICICWPTSWAITCWIILSIGKRCQITHLNAVAGLSDVNSQALFHHEIILTVCLGGKPAMINPQQFFLNFSICSLSSAYCRKLFLDICILWSTCQIE